MLNEKLLCRIALGLIPGIGCKSYRQLLELYSEPSDIFSLNHSELKSLFGEHIDIIAAIEKRQTFKRAEEECLFIEKNKLTPLFCTEPSYPKRLNRADCADTPPLLYLHGYCNLNAKYVVSVVGTRRITPYGRDMAENIIRQIANDDMLIVSGLAYGVDTVAHTAALANHLPTAGVLGHGLDRLYPPQNRNLALKMIEHNGCLLTEYPSQTEINPSYFPARNRIIAALADAVIVVEAAEKGGALITANMANSYHRDVFSVPGRCTDSYSRGCNNLIANNKALIYNNAEDFYYNMGWSRNRKRTVEQKELFVSLNKEEQKIADILKTEVTLGIDELCTKSEYSLPKVAATILNLELKGVIKCLPGKMYKLI